jgi:hypothetical protein
MTPATTGRWNATVARVLLLSPAGYTGSPYSSE